MNNSHAMRKQVDNATDQAASAAEGASGTLHNAVDSVVERSIDVVDAVGRKAAVAADKIDQVRTQAGEKISEKLEQAGAQLSRGKEATMQFLDDLLEGANNLSQRAGRYVRENPGKTFAAVAVVTLVAASAMRSRRNRNSNTEES